MMIQGIMHRSVQRFRQQADRVRTSRAEKAGLVVSFRRPPDVTPSSLSDSEPDLYRARATPLTRSSQRLRAVVFRMVGKDSTSFRRASGLTVMTTTHMLETAGADIAYDFRGPLPTADGRPPLFMIGQPMDASGFATLAPHFPDRTVVTYDPRGLGRSVRRDGRVEDAPTVQAEDVRAVIEALGGGPVEMFASSGGAVAALALVAAYPDDVTTLVAHEPPLIPVLPDAEAAERARAAVRDAYEAKGWGAGMAGFIAMTSWRGEFTDEYFAQAAPDPAHFGMPAEDDGSRDDPLLSDRSWAVSSYRPDVAALAAAPTRIVIAVGEESLDTFTGRTTVATAELLGQKATVFPSHLGGFLGGEFGYAGQPEAFARKLHEVLDRD
jgi:pimeloyl-ACP methyl ester carboxylesterase